MGNPAPRYREKIRERRDREYGTYNALDDKYVQFLEMCLEHPDLDVFDVPRQDRRQPTEAERRQEQMLLTILIPNIGERISDV